MYNFASVLHPRRGIQDKHKGCQFVPSTNSFFHFFFHCCGIFIKIKNICFPKKIYSIYIYIYRKKHFLLIFCLYFQEGLIYIFFPLSILNNINITLIKVTEKNLFLFSGLLHDYNHYKNPIMEILVNLYILRFPEYIFFLSK